MSTSKISSSTITYIVQAVSVGTFGYGVHKLFGSPVDFWAIVGSALVFLGAGWYRAKSSGKAVTVANVVK